MRMIVKGLATVGVWLVTSGVAMAQQSFTELRDLVKPGEVVYVTGASGEETKGRIAAVGASGLRLTVDGLEREWAASDVREVRRRGDSVKNGALIGMVAGGVLGGIGGALLGSLFVNEGASPTRPFLTVLALGAGGGAAIGAGVDGLIPGRTLIYRQAPRAVTISPILSPDVRGMQLALRF